MISLENFHFLRPLWLILIPVAIYLWRRQIRLEDPLRGWRSQLEDHLLSALTVKDQSSRKASGVGLLFFWMLACIALAGPTWRAEPAPFADDPKPIMILLSASRSMNESDLAPSRLQRAQLKIADIANERDGQPLGLIAFAGSSHLVLPPTRDTSIIATMANEINPKIMPVKGCDLVSALKLAEETASQKAGSIIVVADELPGQAAALKNYQPSRGNSIHFLAVALKDSPAMQSIVDASKSVGGRVTELTADSSDIQSILRESLASMDAAVSADGEIRWQESGWWLVPVISIVVAVGFRREKISE